MARIGLAALINALVSILAKRMGCFTNAFTGWLKGILRFLAAAVLTAR